MGALICCFHPPSNIILVGSGTHEDLIEENGYSGGKDKDRWIQAKIITFEMNPAALGNILIISNFKVEEHEKHTIANAFYRTCGDDEKLIRYVKKVGFDIQFLTSIEKHKRCSIETKLLGVSEEKRTELFCSLFKNKRNRALVWR